MASGGQTLRLGSVGQSAVRCGSSKNRQPEIDPAQARESKNVSTAARSASGIAGW